MHYKNFEIAVYIPAWVATSFTKESLAAEYDFIQRYIGLDKVYLETHRSDLDVVSGEAFGLESTAGKLREAFAAELSMSEKKQDYSFAEVILQPGVFRKFRWE